MRGRAVVQLEPGSTILGADGPMAITSLGRHGVHVKAAFSDTDEFVSFAQISARQMTDKGAQHIHMALEPWWSSLDKAARDEALFRLEVVLEILTGYRQGIAQLAEDGEPHFPYGPGYDTSESQRIRAMSQQLSFERGVDRDVMQRVRAGEIATHTVSESTVRMWVKNWREHGLRGLVDGRRARGTQGFHDLDPRLRRITDEVISAFDGDASVVSTKEVERRIRVRIKQQGLSDVKMPERLVQEYLSSRMKQLGRNTRANKGNTLRATAGRFSYPVTGPGHLAIDVTRADNFVYDDVTGKPVSVEIITIIDVATRVVVACRVVPRSALALEAGLALYDAMRPFSMVVQGTTVDDFRWCGIPQSLDFGANPDIVDLPAVRTDRSLQGTHIKPAVAPMSLRADNGSIFLSKPFRAILRDFGVDLMPSRAGRPIDNAFIERWHETLQPAYQRIPGFKGRNVRERGRQVMRADAPMLTAREMETHLHRFVALVYHRSPHDGLRIPGMEDVALTPLERFDMLAAATGRILVPQHPDLIYQFLPVRWLTVGHSGVEYRGLTYDADILENLRGLRSGTFRDQDAKVPFLYDPRDRTRLWHRDRDTDRIHELVWRDAHLVHAPMTDVIVDEARRIVKARGPEPLSKRSVELQIINEITEITSAPTTEEWRNTVIAARLRHEQAQADHREAREARRLVDAGWGTGVTRSPQTSHTHTNAGPVLDQPWPDYDEVI